MSRKRPAPKLPQLLVDLNAVVMAVTGDQPRVLTVAPGATTALAAGVAGAPRALPFGPFDPLHDRTLERCIRQTVTRQTGGELGFVEQLYTFADKGRDPRERDGSGRILSIAYLALAQESALEAAEDARWENCYEYFPWEDWRGGRPALMDEVGAALMEWAGGLSKKTRRVQRERIEICFGLGKVGWDAYKVLERYELLYEARLVGEYWADRTLTPAQDIQERLGSPMAFDHRRILATGLGRVRGKLRYRPVVFELLPERFTLLRLQQVVEALSGLTMHKQNFRRLAERSGLVEGTGRRELSTGGRPAELFRFRRAVLRERRAPGVATLHPPKDM
ncbi:MAG TPA: hypothetical protein VGC50_09155 [Gammaproteobacteria bacterium]|jgi:hypothetical protein